MAFLGQVNAHPVFKLIGMTGQPGPHPYQSFCAKAQLANAPAASGAVPDFPLPARRLKLRRTGDQLKSSASCVAKQTKGTLDTETETTSNVRTESFYATKLQKPVRGWKTKASQPAAANPSKAAVNTNAVAV